MDVNFSDGDKIHIDPRGEDRLIYYLPQGGWKRCVGLQQEYDFHSIPPHTFRFWNDHLARLQSMNDRELTLMIQRYAQYIMKLRLIRPHIAFEFPDWFVERVGESRLCQSFADEGWQFRSKDMNTFQWELVSHGR